MPTFVLETLGCKVNQYEGSTLAEALRSAGWLACGRQRADLVVVHTCAITAEAMRKCRQAIRRLAAAHAPAPVIVTGCCASADSSRLRSLPGVAAVIGCRDDLPAIVSKLATSALMNGGSAEDSLHNTQAGASGYDESNEYSEAATESSPLVTSKPDSPPPVKPLDKLKPMTGRLGSPDASTARNTQLPAGRQRAFLKVQDGCDAGCSYCIVPRLRNHIFSKPCDDVLAEAAALVSAGHHEIVLCGVNLGAYGQRHTDRRRWDRLTSPLPPLLTRLASLPGLNRLRLSSLHPADVSDALLEVLASHATICPHLHLPLQSGSDDVLVRMNRRHTAEEFLETVGRLRRRLDSPALTTDVIVGFPGESEADFEKTLEVARQAAFSKIHVFPFSPREGTAAWAWRDQAPPPEVVKQRRRQLADLERRLAREYRQSFVGQVVRVLVEEDRSLAPGQAAGLTERYIRVQFPAENSADLAGQFVDVQIERPSSAGLTGVRTGA